MKKSLAHLEYLLPQSELDVLQRHATKRHVAPKDTLVKHRSSGRTLFLVLEGTVEISKPQAQSRRLTATPGAPIVIGELTLLSHRMVRTASVTAVSELLVIELSGAKWDRYQSRLPVLAKYVFISASRREPLLTEEERASLAQGAENYRSYLAALESVSASQDGATSRE
jgi:CRP-like cAMP-binding protein